MREEGEKRGKGGEGERENKEEGTGEEKKA